MSFNKIDGYSSESIDKHNKKVESLNVSGATFFPVSGSQVSTYATNTTINAYFELEKAEEGDKKRKIESELELNFGKIASLNTTIIKNNAILNYSPTFVFGVVVFSFLSLAVNESIINLGNLDLTKLLWIGIIYLFVLVVYGKLLDDTIKERTESEKKLLLILRQQEQLEKEASELTKKKYSK